MDSELRNFLVERYSANEWLDVQRRLGNARTADVGSLLPPGWILIKSQRHDSSRPPFVLSLWRSANQEDVLLSVRIIECANTAAAREQLLEELGNFESPIIERRAGAVGEVAFGLRDSMIVFVRANLVVLILNAGPKVVSVYEVAGFLDGMIQEQLL
jgi:hypothetical protein